MMAPLEQFLSDDSESLMPDKPKILPRAVNLVRSTYQPSKAEQKEPLEFPEGTTPDDLTKAVVQPVDVTWKPRPE